MVLAGRARVLVPTPPKILTYHCPCAGVRSSQAELYAGMSQSPISVASEPVDGSLWQQVRKCEADRG